jgi:hypothetical protein
MPKDDLPLLERVDRFTRRYPHIKISVPHNGNGKWEVSRPDCATAAFDRGTDMMDMLDALSAGGLKPPAREADNLTELEAIAEASARRMGLGFEPLRYPDD